jgi:hypothetical protein
MRRGAQAMSMLLSQSGGARDSWRPGARDCVLVAAAEDPELIADDCYLKQALQHSDEGGAVVAPRLLEVASSRAVLSLSLSLYIYIYIYIYIVLYNIYIYI